MHYLAFSLGHKLHSPILLIYFVCMKQIELLHASRSRLTEISLLHNEATNVSALHPHGEPQGSGQMSVNYLVVYVKLIGYFYLNPWSISIHSHPWTVNQRSPYLCIFLKIICQFKWITEVLQINEESTNFYFPQQGFYVPD